MAELLQILPLYLVIGALAGVMAGLLGVGGGLIIVPTIAWTFHTQHVTGDIIMHLAIGTSLATIMITSIASVYAHHLHGAVLWPVFWRLAPGIVVGALLGAAVADALHSDTLQVVFGIFVLVMAAHMAFGARPSPHRELPGVPAMLAVGGVIGLISGIVGIGGGSMTVPFLSWCNIKMGNAVATSAACGFPIALGGTTGYVVLGWHQPGLPAWSAGHVYLPALAGVALISMLSAPLGARLAHRLPSTALRRVFAVFLAVVGVKMLTT